MKTTAVIAAALVVGAVAAAYAREAPSSSASLTAARACPGVDWNLAAHECFRDEHQRFPAGGQDLDCSVRVFTPRPMRFTIRLTYDGHVQRGYTTILRGRSRRAIGVVFPGLGSPPSPGAAAYGLPAGRYGCEFVLGSRRIERVFSLGGSSAPVLMPSVCQGPGTYGHACDFDLAQPGFYPLPPTHSVACSAVFARLQGHQVEFDFLRQTSGAWTPIDVEHATIAHPITEEGAWTSAPPDRFLADGHYACRIIVDGQLAVEKQFDISST